MKCHLCGTYLSEGPNIWNVGGRRLVQLRCLDQRCASIRITKRAEYEVILPDNEIVSYSLFLPYKEQGYRVWAWNNSGSKPGPIATSTVYKLNPVTLSEHLILDVERFYPIDMKDDLKAKSFEILSKLKSLIIFS